MNEKWFLMSVEEIEKKLKTNAASGISPKAARSRANIHKKDTPFFTVKKRSIDRILLDLFSDIFLVLLLLLAILSLFFEGDAIIGAAILTVVAVNIALSFFIYFRDKRTLESMSDFFSPTARVVRDGKLYIADYRDLVEGDVILVEKGDIIGCDARLVHSDSLRVLMKVDKKREEILEKYAGGLVREDELYAQNMVNMIHAGSTVVSGSGRAIVTALGQYTYLGAMTGGIAELPSQVLPEGLANLKRSFSKLGMIFLLLTLPFCAFSVIFGSFEGGNVVLSEAALLAFSIGACAMLSRFSNLFCTFFVRFIRRSAASKDPCILRSLEAFDNLSDVDYLFLLDGSIATDGILHFEKMITADGEVQHFERMGQTSSLLTELAALYYRARSSAPSVGMKSNNEIDSGIKEILDLSGIDTEAMKIRYLLNSYLPGIDRDATEVINYSANAQRGELFVSSSRSLIESCNSIIVAGTRKQLSTEGRNSFLRSFDGFAGMGRRTIIFTLGNEQNRALVGMIILHEGYDPSLPAAVSSIRRSGISVISFSNCEGRENVPEIPDLLRRGSRIYKTDVVRNKLSVTFGLGNYDEYCGFNAKDIAELAKAIKKQGKKLAIFGFTDYAAEAIEYSDVFLSCAPVRSGVFGRFSEEIRSLEIPGSQSSASCTQTVKVEADVLLMRPKDAKGGLRPLATAVTYCRIAYRNLASFIKYFVFSQIIRIVAVALPIMFGQTHADSRHVLIFGLLIDLCAMMIFASDTRLSSRSAQLQKARTELTTFKFLTLFKRDFPLLVSTLAGAFLSLLLPHLIGLLGVFGQYVYRVEYSFCAILLMQFCLFVLIYIPDILDAKEWKKLFSKSLFIVELVASGVFLLLCFLTPIGRFFGLVKNPPMYLIVSIVPAIVLTTCYFIMSFKKSRGNKGSRNERKM